MGSHASPMIRDLHSSTTHLNISTLCGILRVVFVTKWLSDEMAQVEPQSGRVLAPAHDESCELLDLQHGGQHGDQQDVQRRPRARHLRRRGVEAQVEFASKVWRRFVILESQALSSRRFQCGFHEVNLHCLTVAARRCADRDSGASHNTASTASCVSGMAKANT